MKYQLLLFLFVGSICGLQAQNNSLKISPTELSIGKAGLTYERSIGRNLSGLVTLRRIDSREGFFADAFLEVDETEIFFSDRASLQQRGFDAEAALRCYLSSQKKLDGFYIQGGAGAALTDAEIFFTQFTFSSTVVVNEEFPVGEDNLLMLFYTFRTGYQFVWNSGLILDLGVGLKNKHIFPEKESLHTVEKLSGLNLILHIKAGYAF